MRVGVITYCLGYNYGAMLQAYATIKAISALGHEVQLVNYHHPWSFGLNSRDWRNYVGRSPRVVVYKLRTLYRQRELRKRFSPMWTLWPLTEYYGTDAEKLRKSPPKCDCYVTGSDQTWNTSYSRELFAPYFLDFGDDTIKRISYAASLGNVTFKEDDEAWIVGALKRYMAVSVREKGDVDYLKSLGVEGVVQMPDPTMIVSRSVYDELIAGEPHKKYSAVVYMLGGKDREKEALISRMLTDNGILLNDTLNIELQSFHCKGATNKITTVAGWVDAIANAGIVVTNSFHAVVFSLIYGKPFVYVKFSGNKTKSNSRVESLLEGTPEQNRMIELTADIDLSPYMVEPNFETILEGFRHKGNEYLRENIGIEASTRSVDVITKESR